jgi:hypothetical protein
MAEEFRSTESSQAAGRSPRSKMRELVTLMVLGFLIGIVFTLFVGTVLWSLGYVSLGESGCPDGDSICPPTAAVAPTCPTCEVLIVTVTPTRTPTNTPSPTPDIRATATAACETFSEQFPGTPCPPLEATATP